VIIEGNTLTARMFGIEVDGTGGDPTQGELRQLVIRNNDIQLNDFAGVYLLRADGPILTQNTITFNGSDVSRRGVDGRPAIADTLSTGIYADLLVTSPVIEQNIITRTADAVDARVMQNAVVLNEATVTGAVVRSNTFRRHIDGWVHSPCGQDLGMNDRDGIYDRTGGEHMILENICEEALP